MPRPPDVDPQSIRDLLLDDDGNRRSAPEVAADLSETLGRPVSAGLIRSAIMRHGWDKNEIGGKPTAKKYRVDRDLGPIQRRHLRSHDLRMMRTYERIEDGIQAIESEFTQKALAYVQSRLVGGLVTDYCSVNGWRTRPALPWEFGHYYRQAVPDGAGEMITESLEKGLLPGGDQVITDPHRDTWTAWLDLHA